MKDRDIFIDTLPVTALHYTHEHYWRCVMQFDYSQMDTYFNKTNDRERASSVVRFVEDEHQYHYTRMLLERKYLVEHKKLDRNNPAVVKLTLLIRGMIDNPNIEHYPCMHMSTQERFDEMKELGGRFGTRLEFL